MEATPSHTPSLAFTLLQDNVIAVVPPRALRPPLKPLPLHPRRPRRLYDVLTPLLSPAPAPNIWGTETPRCLAAYKPPPPTTPCTMQAPRASSLKPRMSLLPPPQRRTQARRRRPPLYGAQVPPYRGAHPPAVPSRRATTRHVTAHNYMPHPPPHVAQVSFGS